MLSINDINLLQSQNEGLKKQNEQLQRENKNLKQECEKYEKALDEIENYICEYEMLGKLNIKYILNIISRSYWSSDAGQEPLR